MRNFFLGQSTFSWQPFHVEKHVAITSKSIKPCDIQGRWQIENHSTLYSIGIILRLQQKLHRFLISSYIAGISRLCFHIMSHNKCTQELSIYSWHFYCFQCKNRDFTWDEYKRTLIVSNIELYLWIYQVCYNKEVLYKKFLFKPSWL